MLENGRHCCKRVGHMGTTMVECIAWEEMWESESVQRTRCDWHNMKGATTWSMHVCKATSLHSKLRLGTTNEGSLDLDALFSVEVHSSSVQWQSNCIATTNGCRAQSVPAVV